MNARSLRLILITGLTAFAAGAQAQGDNCATAVSVTPGTYVGDGPATGGGHDGTCNGVGSATNGDWYIYTPAADGTVDVYSCLGGTDTRLSVFGGTCGAHTCLGQADDSCPMTIGGAGFASAVYGVGVTAGTPIYVMWDDFWTTAGYTWHLDFHCANAPQATTDVVLDCAGGSFYIEVTITGMGSAVTVDITNDGGAPTISGVGLGTYLIGPFTLGSSIQYVLVNNDDPGCDYFSSAITNFPCPIVSCGPDNYTYCYGNGENTYFVYQATTTDPLALQFNAGGIYAFGGDLITVYDGLNGFAPVLYSGNNGGDLTGLFFVSTNPDHALTLQVTSDGFTSCGDFSISPPWDYTVGCLNCTPPTATYDVIEDCANMVYYVDVSVSSLGSDPDLEITNDGGAPTVVITTPGTYTVGPFPAGSDVTVTLVNDANALCNIHSAVLTNIPCPIISCGPDNYTYCYQNNENQYWVYQSASTDPIAILFNAGGMYPFGGDYISIYNGLDITAPLLYFGNNGGDLSGLFFASSNVDNALSLQITSDAFTSCGDFGVSPPWDYTVACLNCTAPLATFTVVMDCANLVFYIEVNITTLGSDPSLDIINDGGAPALTASTTGTYTTGPYPLDTDVTVTLVNDANSLCNLESPVLTNTIICPVPVICGDPPLNNTYCYTDFDNHGWHWVSSDGTSPLALIFNTGTIESSFYDHLTIYDGPDAFSPVLYDHTDFGLEDLAGLLVVSTGPDLFMQMSSDGSVSCFSGFITNWDWDVACLDCSVPVATFTVVPDCIHREFSVQLDLTSTGSATVADVINSLTTDTVQNLAVGVHMIGPFPMDSTVFLTVLNGDNPLCRQNSPALTASADSCVIVSCGVDNYTYCYENNDDAWFVFQADGAFPITVTFLQGDMLVNDKIVFYNGPDDFSALIYQGNNGGDLTGVAYSSSNADNILALRVLSDPTGSCSDGGAQQPFQWFVSCGLVGVDELTPGDFLIYPNPTNGLLEIQLGQAAEGTIQLQVADMTGRVVIDQPTVLHNGTNAQVDLSGLQNGNYVVQLITDQWVKAHQVTLAR